MHARWVEQRKNGLCQSWPCRPIEGEVAISRPRSPSAGVGGAGVIDFCLPIWPSAAARSGIRVVPNYGPVGATYRAFLRGSTGALV